jgi:hypothetical protein
MLKYTDKKRIKQEEIYRMEVRKTLSTSNEASKDSGKFWKFLNSPFALWLLSSVLLTIITSSVTSYIKNAQVVQEQSRSIKKLTTEITYRVNRLNESVDRYKRVPSPLTDSGNPDETKRDMVEEFVVVRFYDDLRSVDTEGVFKELSDRSLRSLLWELSSLHENGSQRQKEVLKSFDASIKLRRYIEEQSRIVESMRKNIEEDKGSHIYWSRFVFFKERDLVLEILRDLNLVNKGTP